MMPVSSVTEPTVLLWDCRISDLVNTHLAGFYEPGSCQVWEELRKWVDFY